ncbi:MAG: ATP-binding cassette domain-containing protein, partial [Candidatus Peregrinibacteria bacterium]
MIPPLLSITGLRVSVSEREIVRGVDLTVHAGELHVLMGPNGAGKS